ncbi:hypothetical protein [Brevibacterium ravenspurgense]|uniref:hypothetical protein n=1 Tax=Brevibacterium ravenspurgense TaxID=479117 RepID=UPI0002F26447|nr:hypothetical protein [Brevibacterium ravenspurgense]
MNTINRVPAGVPAGGQFSEGHKAEAATTTLVQSSRPQTPMWHDQPLFAQQHELRKRCHEKLNVDAARALERVHPEAAFLTLSRDDDDDDGVRIHSIRDYQNREVYSPTLDALHSWSARSDQHPEVDPELLTCFENVESGTRWSFADDRYFYNEDVSDETSVTALDIDLKQARRDGITPAAYPTVPGAPLHEKVTTAGGRSWRPCRSVDDDNPGYDRTRVEVLTEKPGPRTIVYIGDDPDAQRAVAYAESEARRNGELG